MSGRSRVERAPIHEALLGDYHRKTRHLTQAAQHGAYMLLIGEAWQRGGALPDDDEMLAHGRPAHATNGHR